MGICDGSSGARLLVQYSDDPSLAWNAVTHTWNDVSGVTGTLDVSGGDKPSGEFRTHNGVIAALGDVGLQNINLNVVFQNSASSFLEFLTDTWDGTEAACFYLRWAYNAGASGALRRTAKVALLTNPFTGGDPANPIVSKQLTLVVDGVINRDAVS
ncbi:MAG: hypothetical protein IAE79_07670 [Anaerolinea sp.]|nr:hypothetical protein [Anaerolinea sp.]